ncbi:PTS system, nitrogen regulatory IIA-like protein [Actinobacillus equuli]|nr:PTS system, nitrogen regulatory IIA-like protein [Actinobacillus equuli]
MFPEGSCEKYKDCLHHIAQRLSDKTLIKQLRSAESAEEIWQLLEYADNQVIEQD